MRSSPFEFSLRGASFKIVVMIVIHANKNAIEYTESHSVSTPLTETERNGVRWGSFLLHLIFKLVFEIVKELAQSACENSGNDNELNKNLFS